MAIETVFFSSSYKMVDLSIVNRRYFWCFTPPFFTVRSAAESSLNPPTLMVSSPPWRISPYSKKTLGFVRWYSRWVKPWIKDLTRISFENTDGVRMCHTSMFLYWLVVYLPLWKIMEFVNGKDDIPPIMENKSHVWNYQPVPSGKLT